VKGWIQYFHAYGYGWKWQADAILLRCFGVLTNIEKAKRTFGLNLGSSLESWCKTLVW